jgi:glutaminyl-peptide cyclotransferase
MMDNDIESADLSFDNERWIVPAMRRQNRWFACGVTLFLLGAVALVLTKTYTSPNGLPVDVFDADGGRVGNDASNAKIQEAFDRSNLDRTTHHHPPADKNPFHVSHQNRDDTYYNQMTAYSYRESQARIKQQAILDHWNRTHYGEPLPARFNYSNNWMADHKAVGGYPFSSHPDHNPRTRPERPTKHDPTKTHKNNAQAEDSKHNLDVHNDEVAPPEVSPANEPPKGTMTTAKPVDSGNAKPPAQKHNETALPSETLNTGDVLVDKPADVREEIQPQVNETVAEKILDTEVEQEQDAETTDGTPTGASDAGEDLAKWHSATVTTESGVKFEIVEQIYHDPKSFTQGLSYANGKLYESAGLYGESSVKILDPSSGKAQQVVKMDGQYFAEGMTFYKDKLVQIVWKKARGFVYDANDIAAPPVQYTYETTKFNEGWGLTYDNDNHQLIVTDGSANLIFWDPDCWQTGHCAPLPHKPPIQVTKLDGTPAKNLNEIEYWRGRVLANVWYSDVLLVINPESGKVEKEYGELRDLFINLYGSFISNHSPVSFFAQIFHPSSQSEILAPTFSTASL